jgi:glycosyltransferase involved in cell wall biosynthesis
MNRAGIETFIMNVYRTINRDNIQFDFLLHTREKCDYAEEIYLLGGRIFYVPVRRKGYIKNKNTLRTFFKDHAEYKIIHQHVSSLTYITPLKIAKHCNIPIRIIHSHNIKFGVNNLFVTIHHNLSHYINKIFLPQYATHIFACSELAGLWISHFRKFNIIHNAIYSEKFMFNHDIRSYMREKMNINGKFVIGLVARFFEQKNHFFLIEIFKNILKIKKNTCLLLIGDGPLLNKIEDKVEEYGMEMDVIFLGIRDVVNNILQAMDVFVMTSFYEGLPVSLIEAQASGLKCVVSKEAVPSEAKIIEDITFLSINNGVDIWANEILAPRLESRTSHQRNEIIQAGYDIAVVSKTLESYYIDGINELQKKCIDKIRST